ncbi:hypothetical protein OIO90_004128 [Microbotryomycetes sp. JL221]|nr:hypothetical protein OIO90_004128 [Microbotryomycetes sp. JL221]
MSEHATTAPNPPPPPTPPLSLSIPPPNPPPPPSNASMPPHHSHQQSNSTRRITSWGSNLSETGSLSAVDDRFMTPLPSPGGQGTFNNWSASSSKDWGFFPHHSSTQYGSSSKSDTTSWASSIGRTSSVKSSRSTSVFEEIRTSNEFGERVNNSTESTLNTFASPSSKSKTMSFFDTDASISPTPPPNPPSRGNSLRSNNGDRHAQDGVDLSRAGSWRQRLDASLKPWNGHSRERSGSGGSIGTTASVSSPVSMKTFASPDRHNEGPMARSPDTSFARTGKPLLHALKTTTLRDEPAPTSAAVLNRPMTALPTPSESPLSRPVQPLVDGTRTSRPPPIDLGGAAYVPGHREPGSTTPVTPSMDEVAAARAQSTTLHVDEGDDDEQVPLLSGDILGDYQVIRLLGKGAFSHVALGKRKLTSSRDCEDERNELVALKLVPVKRYKGNDRMRISVLREIDVLKNVHHPGLISLQTSFTTSLYTVLALEYAPGGELFDFIGNFHSNVSEALARRIFGELASAVGWMHSIGLVHRDIKLENVLLMSRPFSRAGTNESLDLATLPQPFVKLTDFGLSRFISTSSPTLTTRCGSEAYAAPELILSRPYDGRQTDAWALGVVLFAIVTGVLPFVEVPTTQGTKSRKSFLLRIAKGEYHWPVNDRANENGSHDYTTSQDDRTGTNVIGQTSMDADSTRLVTPQVKQVVGRLLVRDPMKRAVVDDVWSMEWMQGPGRPRRLEGYVSSSTTSQQVQESNGAQQLREMWARRGSGL